MLFGLVALDKGEEKLLMVNSEVVDPDASEEEAFRQGWMEFVPLGMVDHYKWDGWRAYELVSEAQAVLCAADLGVTFLRVIAAR